MFFKRYCFLFLCLLPLFVLAQTPDSAFIRTQQLKPVSVMALKPTYFLPGSRIVILDSAALNTGNAGSLADILKTRTPLFLKNYGQGQLVSISLRGTSARHTALLWNGLNINFPTLGEADFSLIPVNANSNVTIQHGSASSSYGTGAIGGTILLENPLNFTKGYRVSAQQDFGSFGRQYSSLGGNFSTGKISLNTTLFQQQSNNDFEFTNTAKFGEPVEKLQNAASKQKGFTQDIGYKLNDRSYLAFKSWFNLTGRQIQASMVTAHNNAREKDRSLRLLGEYTLQTDFGKSVVKAAFFEDIINYSNDNITANSKVKTYQTVAEHQVILSEKVNLKAGADLQHFGADVDGYNQPVAENRASVFTLLRYDPGKRLGLSLNIRQSFTEKYNPPLTPSFGLQYLVLRDSVVSLSVKSSIAKSFRVPTLNERFWPTGNPNIKPETGMSYEAGITNEFMTSSGNISTEITAYRMLVSEWIQWVPGRTGQDWTPRNLSQVEASGIEFSARYNYRHNLVNFTIGGGYTYTSSVQKEAYLGAEQGKQLIYVPLHSVNMYSDVIFGQFMFSGNAGYTGLRYTSSTNDASLPAYFLANASGGYIFYRNQYQAQLLFTINNLTNTIYHPIAYQAMPPRNYGISMRFTIRNPEKSTIN